MTLQECWQVFIANHRIDLPLVRVYPVAVPANPVAPWAVVRRVSGKGGQNLDGTSQLNMVRVEVTFWANSNKQAEQLTLALNKIMTGYRGYLGDFTNGRFAATSTSGPRELYDSETRMFGMQLDILGLLDEDTLS